MYKRILMISDLLGVSNDPPPQVPVLAIVARSQLGDDNDDDGVDDSHDVESCTELSKTSCKCSLCQIMYITLILMTNIETCLPRKYKPGLTRLIQEFIYRWHHPDLSVHDIPHLPPFYKKTTIHTSTIATFHAPNDPSVIGSIKCECIHC